MCGRLFGSPIDAAFHMFWATEDYTSRDHRYSGRHEYVTGFIASVHPTTSEVYNSAPKDTVKNPNGFYMLRFGNITSESTATGPVSNQAPLDSDALF